MARLKAHWPEYLIEAMCLALFVTSATACATLVNHPSSPLAASIMSPFWRRALMGAAMGLTAIAIIYSPPGRRSGAHMNPAVTLSFWWLGRIHRHDAAAYIAAQFAGGWLGAVTAVSVLGGLPAHPSVNYVATLPGAGGPLVALLAETAISFLMMTTVLVCSARRETSGLAGFAAGSLVALFIVFEDPLSGMSMNPARSLGPALVGGNTSSLWIYFVGPIVGMLAAADVFARGAAS